MKKQTILALWLLSSFLLGIGCNSTLPFLKTNPEPLSISSGDPENEGIAKMAGEKPALTGSLPTDSDSVTTFSDSLDRQSLTDLALYWITQSDSDLVQGDTLAAEESMVLAISSLASALMNLTPLERVTWIDSLADWSITYSKLMGGEFGPYAPGEEGLSGMIRETYSDSAVVDSIMSQIATDTFQVVIDTTLDMISHLPEIPDTMNAKVQNVIDYFTGNPKGRKAMQVWFDRAGEMLPIIQPILHKQGVPEDLVYLAMIESGFRHDARSWARAVGPWQFIRSTAKIFDLKVDWWYDERRNPEKSTVAGAKYLRQLYEHLGDWYLAMAGYNCGEGRVWRDRRRSRSKDFWKLKRLPRQTRQYLPTFLAARRMAKSPEEYGFDPIQLVEPEPKDSILITECTDLSAIAEALDTTLEEIRKLNPEILRWCTPPNMDSVIVYVPRGKAENWQQKIASIPEEKRTSWVRHQVKSGESLSLIAKKYRTTVQAILDVPANKLKNPNRIKKGKFILVPVVPEGLKADFSNVDFLADSELPDGAERRIHRVRRNDTLSEIAEKYGVGLSKLLRWNNLSLRSPIYPGQKIVIYPPAGRVSTKKKKSKIKVTPGAATYTVRKGDTAWDIARAHGIMLSDLLAANGMGRSSVLHPGQVLNIPSRTVEKVAALPPDLPEVYVVKKGDSLSQIAGQYKLDIQDLIEWNAITNVNRIKPGDKIRLKPQEDKS